MDNVALISLIQRYKSDPESAYNTWFIGGPERMKAFRAIRRGVRDTVAGIAAGTFGNDFRGSPLEVVLAAITEQKRVFHGAAHPFYWKPKLRIPDIYENEANQRNFGAFLGACLAATREEQVLAELSRLAELRIKGLGPAVASIIYFLHPTVVPPSNTAIVNGYNALFGDKKKLGSWESYLAMREVIVRTNAEVRDHLSKDLGRALNYDVYVARNDRHRSYDGQAFAQLTLPELPPLGWSPEITDTVGLIDVIWLKPGGGEIVSAFEVEKSTSIYSGILRMEDLARSLPGCACHFYLVAPDVRAKEVLAQLARPAFRDDLRDIPMAFIPFGALCEHCDALCKFGEDHTILRKIARDRPRL